MGIHPHVQWTGIALHFAVLTDCLADGKDMGFIKTIGVR